MIPILIKAKNNLKKLIKNSFHHFKNLKKKYTKYIKIDKIIQFLMTNS
jgi:uncharacterized protein YsxB (DUF464 family)